MSNISSQAAAAREGARQRSGEFGEQHKSDPGQLDLDGGSATDVWLDQWREADPSDFDAAEAALFDERSKAEAHVIRWEKQAHYDAGDHFDYYRKTWTMRNADAEANARADTVKSLAEARAQVAEIDARVDAMEALYQERGSWNRAFLVTSSEGKVHSSMRCSTCNNGRYATQFAWMTEFSGKSEDEIVQAAGYRACTTCYSSAPVDADERSHPTQMFSQEERDKAAERDARAAKRDAAAAARIEKGLTADGSPLRFEIPRSGQRWHTDKTTGEYVFGPDEWSERVELKTERTGVTWATDTLVAGRGSEVKPVVLALAAKHSQEPQAVLDDLMAKANVRAKREHRDPVKPPEMDFDS